MAATTINIPITVYSFDPANRKVTFTNLSVVDPSRVMAIYDTTLNPQGYEDGTVLYLAEQAAQASVTGNVLTLPDGSIPVMARASDNLKITYNVTPPRGWPLLRFTNHAAFPATGVPETWYLANDTGQTYVWDGAAFIAI